MPNVGLTVELGLFLLCVLRRILHLNSLISIYFVQYIFFSFLFSHFALYFRSPALIGCFVVDRKYFEEIGLLDEGMEIYGGENVELGIRVSWFENLYLISRTSMATTCHKYTVFV